MECKRFLIDFNAFQQFDIENIYLFCVFISPVNFKSISYQLAIRYDLACFSCLMFETKNEMAVQSIAIARHINSLAFRKSFELHQQKYLSEIAIAMSKWVIANRQSQSFGIFFKKNRVEHLTGPWR